MTEVLRVDISRIYWKKVGGSTVGKMVLRLQSWGVGKREPRHMQAPHESCRSEERHVSRDE